MAKNIVLIGMMGAGKTTIGKLLSDMLSDYEFIDMDSVIEKEEGCSISTLFKEKGEPYFRNLETFYAAKYADSENKIISTGGGFAQKDENLKHLMKNGILFYLYASAEILAKRVKDDNSRPLLYNTDIKKQINDLLEKRDFNYRKSNIILSTEDKTPQKTALEIIDEYKKYAEC